jgi:hypothetical protein
MKECIYYKSWNFHALHNFFEITMNFEVIVKKIHINYTIYFETSIILLHV